jgi:hypothetical protein
MESPKELWAVFPGKFRGKILEGLKQQGLMEKLTGRGLRFV